MNNVLPSDVESIIITLLGDAEFTRYVATTLPLPLILGTSLSSCLLYSPFLFIRLCMTTTSRGHLQRLLLRKLTIHETFPPSLRYPLIVETLLAIPLKRATWSTIWRQAEVFKQTFVSLSELTLDSRYSKIGQACWASQLPRLRRLTTAYTTILRKKTTPSDFIVFLYLEELSLLFPRCHFTSPKYTSSTYCLAQFPMVRKLEIEEWTMMTSCLYNLPKVAYMNNKNVLDIITRGTPRLQHLVITHNDISGRVYDPTHISPYQPSIPSLRQVDLRAHAASAFDYDDIRRQNVIALCLANRGIESVTVCNAAVLVGNPSYDLLIDWYAFMDAAPITFFEASVYYCRTRPEGEIPRSYCVHLDRLRLAFDLDCEGWVIMEDHTRHWLRHPSTFPVLIEDDSGFKGMRERNYRIETIGSERGTFFRFSKPSASSSCPRLVSNV